MEFFEILKLEHSNVGFDSGKSWKVQLEQIGGYTERHYKKIGQADMKILMVNSQYAPFSSGGADISTRKLAVELHRQGHDVVVLTCSDENAEDDVDNITVYRRRFHNIESWYNYGSLSFIKKIIYKAIDYYNIFNYHTLKKLIEDIRPDVVHTNNVNGISPVIWKAAKKCGVPVVHTCRDYYLLCQKTTLTHGNGKSCDNPKILCRIWKCFYRRISNNIDVVTAPSTYTLKCFLEEEFFSKSMKEIIYNAIDIDAEETDRILASRRKRHSGEFKFLYLGAVAQYKGVDVLMRAFESIKNRNIKLYIGGNGSLVEDIVRNEKYNSSIFYLGFLNQDEMRKYLCECDALICPSNWPEPFGRVIIDAYRHAMPVIASDIGGLSEIVSSKTGYQVEPGNSYCLAEAMIKMTTDKKKYIEMCKEAAKYIEQFGIIQQAHRFISIYNKVRK